MDVLPPLPGRWEWLPAPLCRRGRPHPPPSVLCLLRPAQGHKPYACYAARLKASLIPLGCTHISLLACLGLCL